MANIATLSVSLVANTARFSQALVAANGNAKKHASDIGKNLAGIGSAAGGMMVNGLMAGAGAIATFGAAVVANTMHTAKNIKEQVNLSRQIGVNVNQYRALTSQLATFGVTADDVWSGLKDLNLKISELAITGGGAFKDLTDSVKINVKEWNMADPIRQLEMFAEATKDMSENNRRQFADALGSDALLKVMDALKASGKDINGIMADYKAMGGFVTKNDLAMLDQANKTWSKLGLQIDVVKERFGIAFAPIVETVMQKASEYLLDIEKQEGGMRKWALDTAQTITLTVYDVMEFLVNTFQNIYRAVIEVHNAWANMPNTDAEPIKIEMSTTSLEKQLKERSDELSKAEERLKKALTAREVTKKLMQEKPLPELYNMRLNNNNDTVEKRQSEVGTLEFGVQSLKRQIAESVDSGFSGGLKASREKALKFFADMEKDIAKSDALKKTDNDPNDPNTPNKPTPPKSDGMFGAGRKDALADYSSMISSALSARSVIENNYKESLKKLEGYRLANTLSEAEVAKGQVILQADYDKQILDNKIANLERFGLAKQADELKFEKNLAETRKLEEEGEFTREQAALAREKLADDDFKKYQSYSQERIDLLNKMGLAEKANDMQRQLALDDISHQQLFNKITEEEAEEMRSVIADNEKERLAGRLDSLGLEAEALQLRQEIELDALAKGYEEKLLTEQEYLEAKAEMENEHFEQQREVWTESLSGFQEDMWGAWESISDGVGDSFANMIVNGADFGKSMQNVFKQMAVQYIAEKVKMFLIDKMYAMFASKTNAKAAVAKGTEKVAEASLNALTSFAAAPWPINIGAPAFAAMIGGLAGGFAGGMTAAAASGAVSGQFHDGGEVPHTGTYILEGGEIVVPKNEARAITNLRELKSTSNTSAPVQLTVQVSTIDSKSFIDHIDLIEGHLAGFVQKYSN